MSSLVICSVISLLACAPAAAQPVSDRDHEAAVEAFREGMQALGSERYDEAESAFKKAVRLDPDYDAAFFGLGQTYMATKRYDQALGAYLSCRDAFTKAVANEALQGAQADRRIQDQIDALRDYERQINNPTTRSQPGLDNARERVRSQIKALETRLSRNRTGTIPVPAGVSLAIGSAYFRLNKLADAEREYKAAIDVDPNLGEAHSNLAVVYLVTGRYKEAQASVSAAEKSGFRVNPRLKEDIEKGLGG
jgi:tetratricopeptide (TPR) repeat protein